MWRHKIDCLTWSSRHQRGLVHWCPCNRNLHAWMPAQHWVPAICCHPCEAWSEHPGRENVDLVPKRRKRELCIMYVIQPHITIMENSDCSHHCFYVLTRSTEQLSHEHALGIRRWEEGEVRRRGDWRMGWGVGDGGMGGTGWKGGTGQGGARRGRGVRVGGDAHTQKLILQKFAAHTEMFPLFDWWQCSDMRHDASRQTSVGILTSMTDIQ